MRFSQIHDILKAFSRKKYLLINYPNLTLNKLEIGEMLAGKLNSGKLVCKKLVAHERFRKLRE